MNAHNKSYFGKSLSQLADELADDDCVVTVEKVGDGVVMETWHISEVPMAPTTKIRWYGW